MADRPQSRNGGIGFALLIQENSGLELNGGEMTMPIIAIQSMHFGQFSHSSIGQGFKSIFEPRNVVGLIIDL